MPSETIFRILFWILIAGVLLMRVFFTLQVRLAGERVMPDRAAIRREGIGAFLVRFVGFFLIIGLLAASALQPAWLAALSIPIPDIVRGSGFLLGLAGLGIWIWAQIVLGREWSPQLQLREQHRLVTAGPYARMRHPIYSGMIVWAGGLALLTANWIFLGIALLVGAVFVARVPREEQMMLDQFGEAYREYMKRTGRIFPKI
jgi:protein-S-isoprenylcysteine O-methyltransferase Ste14